VQLAHAARVEAHVDAGYALGDAELSFGDLPRPAAALLPDVRIRIGEAQVRQGAVIGRGRIDHVGILQLAHEIARSRIGSADARRAARFNFGRGGALGAQKRACADSGSGQNIASGCGGHQVLPRGFIVHTERPEIRRVEAGGRSARR
jgi:hypothetical protein